MCAANLDVRPYRTITVTPISGSLGAEIGGVDLADDVDDDVVAEIRQAWLAHLVVFFRDQVLEICHTIRAKERSGVSRSVEGGSLETIRQMVAGGVGITVLPATSVSPGVALALVSTIGFLGFLLGPPLIGFLAQIFSLRTAFGLVALVAMGIGVLASLPNPVPVATPQAEPVA